MNGQYMAMNDDAPKFDKVSGQPLNDAARQVRQNQISSGVTPPAAPTFAGVQQMNAGARGFTHAQENAIARDVDQVVSYDAADRADIGGHITLRIMLVGDPGVGKSSYVNTARAVFNNDVYMEDAGVGEGQSTVTEMAESYCLLRDKKDHLRFTDTRGWVGVTEEVCQNIERMLAGSLDTGNKSMMNFEKEGVDKKTWYMTEAAKSFTGVYGTHHACVYFIDASAVVVSEAKFTEMTENIIDCFSALKSQGGFEPAFFVTKVDKIRITNPNWQYKHFVEQIVARVNAGKGPRFDPETGQPSFESSFSDAANITVRKNQFHVRD